MTRRMRLSLSAVVVVVGLLLVVVGISTGKRGAVVIGILVAGVAAQQFISARKQSDDHG